MSRYALIHTLLVATWVSGPVVAPKAVDFSSPSASGPASIDVSFVSSTLWYEMRSITFRGDLAWIAMEMGVLALDLSSPETPVYRSQIELFGDSAHAVLADGDYLHVALGPGGIATYNIQDPLNPSAVGRVTIPGEALDLTADGAYLYVAAGDSGLHIMDLTVPGSPSSISTYGTPGRARAIVVDQGRAYMADEYWGLAIVDVSNALMPVQVGTMNTPGFAADVYAAGDFAYIADRGTGMIIVDVSNPASPNLAGVFTEETLPLTVSAVGTSVLVGGGASLRVVDVSNPSTPTQQSQSSYGIFPRNLHVTADTVYLLGHGGLQLVYVGDPATQTPVGSHLTPRYTVLGVYGNDSLCLASMCGSGLGIIDLREPLRPVLLGTDSSSCATAAILEGTIAYVADQDNFRTYDISDPTDPELLMAFGGIDAFDLTLRGDTAFVVSGDQGFHIFDVVDPSNLQAIGHWVTQGVLNDLDVQDTLVFAVNNRNPTGHVVDVALPGGPVTLSTWGTYNAGDVEVHGDFAYVRDINRPLRIYDIVDPRAVVLVGEYRDFIGARALSVVGSTAFVASYGGLYVFDVAEPTNPILDTFVATPGPAGAVMATDTHIFLEVDDRVFIYAYTH